MKKTVVLCLILTLCYAVAPLSGVSYIFIILAAALTASLCLKHGAVVGAAVTFAGAAAAYAVSGFDIVSTFFILISSAFAGFGIYLSVKNKIVLRDTVLTGTIGFLFGIFVLYAASVFINGGNMFVDTLESSRTTVIAQLNTLARELDLDKEIFSALVKMYNSTFDTIIILLPGIILTFTLLISYIGVLIVKRISRHEADMDYLTRFNRFTVPWPVSVLFVAGYGISSISGAGSVLRGICMNIAFVASAFITLAGLAVPDFFVSKKIKKAYARVIIYIAVIIVCSVISVVLPIFNPLLLLFVIGLADTVLDFRKIRPIKIIFK